MWYVTVPIVLVLGFIAWRWTSVARGARNRDERLLKMMDPIGERLDRGETVSQEEIQQLAQRPEIRFMLFNGIRSMDRADLIPAGFDTELMQAESSLTYWLMHPNEMGDAPEKIEYIRGVIHPLEGREDTFHVFRYKMRDGHRAARDGWLLGVVGPMDRTAEPYSYLPGAFSRFDKEGMITPEELVAWYVRTVK